MVDQDGAKQTSVQLIDFIGPRKNVWIFNTVWNCKFKRQLTKFVNFFYSLNLIEIANIPNVID